MGRVLIIAQGLDGGIARMASLLARGLAGRGWTAGVLYVGRPTQANAMLRDGADGLDSRALVTGHARTPAEVMGGLRVIPAIGGEIDRRRPDLVIVAGMTPAILYAQAIRRRTAAPILFWDHGAQRSFAALKGLLFGRALAAISHHVAVSTLARDHLVKRFAIPFNRTSVIVNAVEGGPVEGEEAKDFQRLRLVMPARLDLGQKDPVTLIRAVGLAAARGVDITLDLAGDGPHRRRVEAAARRLAPEGRARLLGEVADMGEILPRYNVTCLSSHYESFGLVLAEGMLAGHLAIGSRVEGVVDVLREGATGYLFPAGDAGALAALLASLPKRGPEARGVAAAGQAEARRLYAPPRFLDAFEALCRRLLAPGGPGWPGGEEGL